MGLADHRYYQLVSNSIRSRSTLGKPYQVLDVALRPLHRGIGQCLWGKLHLPCQCQHADARAAARRSVAAASIAMTKIMLSMIIKKEFIRTGKSW